MHCTLKMTTGELQNDKITIGALKKLTKIEVKSEETTMKPQLCCEINEAGAKCIKPVK